MRKVKKALMLTLAMLIMLSGFISGSASDFGVESKIDPDLENRMKTAQADEKIPVMIWMNEEKSIIEQAEAQAEKNELAKNPNLKTIKKYKQSYINEKREISSKLYKEHNKKYFDKIFPKEKEYLFGLIKTKEEQPKVRYVSKYSPVVFAEMTVEEIKDKQYDENIDTIYYDVSAEQSADQATASTGASIGVKSSSIADSDNSVILTNLALNRDTYGLNGKGIKIGMIEDSLPENSSTHYNKNSIQFDNNGTQTRDVEHATTVAKLLIGNTDLKGAVPGATIVATSAGSSNWKQRLEWLISKNVNVINMSWSIVTTFDDEYNAYSRWIDHIAMQHDVHVVIAVGNEPDKTHGTINTIAPPAHGNNVIAVGAINGSGSNSKNWSVAPYSCYLSKSSGTTQYKPDVSAFGYAYSYDKGTSFAAPLVTGLVTQLCQINSELKVRQDVVKSIVMAGAVNMTDKKAGMIERIGAGCIDGKASRYIANSARYKGGKFTSDTNTYTKTFNVTSSDTLTRVALSWLKGNKVNTTNHKDGTGTNPALAKLTLKVKAPNGTTWTSKYSAGSVQLISFKPPVTGKYTITVTRTTEKSSTTYYGLCWY